MPKPNIANQSISSDDSMAVVVHFVQLFLQKITREEFVDLLKARKINAKQFVNLLRKHKCFEIVHYTIRMNRLGRLLPKLTQQITRIVDRRNTHNDALWQEYTSFSNKLKAAKIDHILYKGRAFSDEFYPSNSLRNSVDIDLGIELKNIPQASAILYGLGYEAYKHTPNYDSLSQSRAYYIDFSYVKRDQDGKIMYNIELHWQAAHKVLEVPFVFEEVHTLGSPKMLEGLEVFTFPKIELAVLLVIHHGIVDVWGQLRHLVDLHYVVDNLNEQEMNEFTNRLKTLNLFRSFKAGLGQLKILYNEDKPDRLWQLILSGNMSKNWSEFPLKLWWHLKMRDSLGDKLKVLYSLAKFRLKFH